MRYKAFISYSHTDDVFATRLHERLERYRLPRRIVVDRQLNGNRLGVIFQDREELASSASLTDTIREALADSECLIVVCSPVSAGSRWVNAEIDVFRALHPDGSILPIVPDTVPEGPVSALFPAALRGAQEPLAADARPERDGPQRAFLKLVAGLAGVRFDDLRQRELTRRRQRVVGIAAGVAFGAAVAGGLLHQARVAEEAAAERKAQADALISYLVTDLEGRLAEYEKVGELDQGLSQALNYFGSLDADDLDESTLEKYRVALIGVGSVRLRQGKLDEALSSFERAVELSTVHTLRVETDPEGWFELSQNTYYVGEAYWEMQDIPLAAEHVQAALDYARRAATLAPSNADYRLEVVFGLNNMGAIDTRLKRYAAAVESLEASLAENEVLKRRFPDRRTELLDQEVESVSWLAEILPTLGDYEQAFTWHQREIALRQQRFDETGNVAHLARLADALGYYARTLAAVGRTADARAALERKIEISQRLRRQDPDNALWEEREHLATLLLATEVFHLGDLTAANGLLDRAEAGLKGELVEDRNVDLVELHLSYLASSRAYFALDEPARAIGYLEQAFATLEARPGDAEPGPLRFDYYLRAVVLEAAARRLAGMAPNTERIEAALTLMREQGEPEHSVADAAMLGLLELAGDLGDRGEGRFEWVDGKGYRSAFFESLREKLQG